MTNTLYMIPVLLFTLLFGLTGCESDKAENITQWPLVTDCNLHTDTCAARVGQAEVSLSISPRPIPIARQLIIEVNTENLVAQKVELDISGINMYMGYNRITLTPTKPGQFMGNSMLAFCTNDKMLWQLTLMIHQPDGSQIQVPFSLTTQNR